MPLMHVRCAFVLAFIGKLVAASLQKMVRVAAIGHQRFLKHASGLSVTPARGKERVTLNAPALPIALPKDRYCYAHVRPK